jgi:hypothetical protein
MTDPVKLDVQKFASREAKKVEAWLGSNWIPFGTGIALAEFVNWIIHKL